MIFLFDLVNEAIRQSKWYIKICLIFHFYIFIPASIVVAIYFIFTEDIFLKIIGILTLCSYAFIIGVLISFD